MHRVPCYFPGDVGKLTVCCTPELMHRYQGSHICVLSSKGNRSQADMFSGGDCDGDSVYVYWDSEMVAAWQHVDPLPPMAAIERSLVLPSDPGELPGALMRFFKQAIVGCTLGRLEKTLRRVADQHGATSDRALELAEYCMQAVYIVDIYRALELAEYCMQAVDSPDEPIKPPAHRAVTGRSHARESQGPGGAKPHWGCSRTAWMGT
eukprot:TRINITY_DN9451_c0_g1_i4.p2 TRINITY_DN9451_c0_g1~~TRINITY_DN9451_c0_g1_i4.p2  ORF type:complete len:207 (-),score=46.51 TRINITY_DN9451_c0_g1_i4:676-1296(-)